MKQSSRYVVFPTLVCLFGLSAVFNAQAEDIRDVKPPVEFPARWMAALIVLGISFLAGLGYVLYRRYQRGIPPRPNIAAKTPWEKAYERLEDLLKGDLLVRGEWEQYYLTLSDIVRRYFEERFEIRAPEMTSEEFLMSLKNFGGLPAESKILLEEFLGVCDMVKFAKHAPDAAQAQKDTVLARRLVDETRTLK